MLSLRLREPLLIAALAASLAGCPIPPDPNDPHGGPCLGYVCSPKGARAMLLDVLGESPTPLHGAERETRALLDRATATMAERGYTEETFRIARDALKKILEASPHGAGGTKARELEKVNTRRHWLCPLWPLC